MPDSDVEQKSPPSWQNVEFVSSPSDPQVDRKIMEAVDELSAQHISANPFVVDSMSDPRLFNSLPEETRGSNSLLGEYIEHMGKFSDILNKERDKRSRGDTSGLFGDEVKAADVTHQSGVARREESGYKVNVDYLASCGIDPDKVLFFRLTQPMGDVPKPEYYWTSDLGEVVKGLRMEVSGENRMNAVVLVSTLAKINENGGLIQDVNDDQGLAVRQIGSSPFDQQQALGRFKV